MIEKISLDDLDINYSGLYHLENLKNLTLSVKNNTQHLDFSKFSKLEILSIDWYQKFPNLTQTNRLKELYMWKFRPKTQSLSALQLPNSLEVLHITQSNIRTFNGLILPNLKNFGAYYCNAVESVEGIDKISKVLQTLILEYSHKLTSYDRLKLCKELEKIIIVDCGDIPNLLWLRELKKVKHFSFWNTKLNDGDTAPCFGIDYVSFKNAKHYNHKEEEFIKQL